MIEINRINSPTLFMLLMRKIIQGPLIRLDRWHECDKLITFRRSLVEGGRRKLLLYVCTLIDRNRDSNSIFNFLINR